MKYIKDFKLFEHYSDNGFKLNYNSGWYSLSFKKSPFVLTNGKILTPIEPKSLDQAMEWHGKVPAVAYMSSTNKKMLEDIKDYFTQNNNEEDIFNMDSTLVPFGGFWDYEFYLLDSKDENANMFKNRPMVSHIFHKYLGKMEENGMLFKNEKDALKDNRIYTLFYISRDELSNNKPVIIDITDQLKENGILK